MLYASQIPNFRDFFKAENILKGSLDSMPSPSVKIQIMDEKVFLTCKDKILLSVSNIFLKTKTKI